MWGGRLETNLGLGGRGWDLLCASSVRLECTITVVVTGLAVESLCLEEATEEIAGTLEGAPFTKFLCFLFKVLKGFPDGICNRLRDFGAFILVTFSPVTLGLLVLSKVCIRVVALEVNGFLGKEYSPSNFFGLTTRVGLDWTAFGTSLVGLLPRDLAFNWEFLLSLCGMGVDEACG